MPAGASRAGDSPKARALVEQNIKPTNKGRRPWELKGHLFCECGVRMTTHTTTRKGRKVVYYYYVCNRHKHDGTGACPLSRGRGT